MNNIKVENIYFENCSTFSHLHRFWEYKNIYAKNLTYLNNDVSKMLIVQPMINLLDIYGEFKVDGI